ncbi:MAG: hypothetical protein ABI091_24845 [Ferruginibacter sp.]
MASCNTKPSAPAVTIYPNNLVSDNTKGAVTAIETDSSPIESAGKPGTIISPCWCFHQQVLTIKIFYQQDQRLSQSVN